MLLTQNKFANEHTDTPQWFELNVLRIDETETDLTGKNLVPVYHHGNSKLTLGLAVLVTERRMKLPGVSEILQENVIMSVCLFEG